MFSLPDFVPCCLLLIFFICSSFAHFAHLGFGLIFDQDVEELRQKLQRVEIDTALSQADSNFLQRALEDREAELKEKEADISEHFFLFIFSIHHQISYPANVYTFMQILSTALW